MISNASSINTFLRCKFHFKQSVLKSSSLHYPSSLHYFTTILKSSLSSLSLVQPPPPTQIPQKNDHAEQIDAIPHASYSGLPQVSYLPTLPYFALSYPLGLSLVSEKCPTLPTTVYSLQVSYPKLHNHEECANNGNKRKKTGGQQGTS